MAGLRARLLLPVVLLGGCAGELAPPALDYSGPTADWPAYGGSPDIDTTMPLWIQTGATSTFETTRPVSIGPRRGSRFYDR